MAEKSVTIRIAMEGGKVVEAQLLGVGKAGAAAMTDIGRSSGAMKAGLANASFQVQDFFVQVAGGTSATRAMSQQLPQLLGSFGLFGILAGTAAAALIPLAAQLWDLEPPAEAAERAIKNLETALSELRAIEREANAPIDDMVKKYGAQAGAAREVLEIERQLAQIKAERDFAAAAAATSKAFGAGSDGGDVGQLAAEVAVVGQLQQEYARLTAEMEALSKSKNLAGAGLQVAMNSLLMERDEIQGRIDAFGDLGASIDNIAKSFGITNTEAQRLVELAGAIGASDTTAQRAAATRALTVAIYQSTDGLRSLGETSEEASAEGFKLYDVLLSAAMSGLSLQQLDLASGIGAGADEAGRLAGNLSAAAANAWAVVSAQDRARHNMATEYIADNQRGGTAYLANQYAQYGAGHSAMVTAQTNADDLYGAPAAPKASGGGGGGGASAQSDMLRAAEQLYEQTRTEAEKYTAEVARLDEMLAAGVIDQDLYNRGLEAAAEKFGAASEAAEFFKDLNVDLKATILDMAMGSVDSLEKLIDALKRAAYEAALFGTGPIADILGITTGLFGGTSSFMNDLFGLSGASATTAKVDASGMSAKSMAVPPTGPSFDYQMLLDILNDVSGPGAMGPGGAASGRSSAGAAPGGSTPAPARVDVVVTLGAGLDAQVQSVAENVSVRVSRDTVAQYDREVLPGRIKAISRDPKRTR